MVTGMKKALYAATLGAASVFAQDLPRRDLTGYPDYKVEFNVSGIFRIFGSDLKGAIPALAAGFAAYQPGASIGIYNYTSSEGSLAGLYTGLSELAPAGDDAKLTDMMPFFNSYGYLPTEISIATGGHEKRGTLWPAVIVVHKDNPLERLTMDQLDRIFSSERIGGWKLGTNDNLASVSEGDNILFTAEYARNASTNIRKWSQLGIEGEWADKEIQTYGYIAPGFVIYMQRKLFHWSQKWNPNYKEYVEEKQATADDDGKPVASDRMLEELSNDKYGIGWGAQLHIKDYPKVKPIAIAQNSSGPYFEFSPQTVSDRNYPLARDAYIYLNRAPGQPVDPKTREFLRFVLSKRGQEIIAGLDKYYALILPELESQLSRLE
ncbi:unnamed protein product [Clonostachys rosea f. rosea IK726]|uniref:Uncharacterized protein n=1 Tax=Clonostachys rosea f. rosea IK726 TaxID=1349383 RepID=A0ACA9UTS5_BIOOC|nr:unnamed protein product [Clonostachys rosea f. rosea IK726]